MFEHYLTYQKTDPRRQRRIAIASVVSGTLTFSGIIFVWAANKMNITKVDPPTVQFLMVQMSAEEAAPPPPPPPPPAAAETQEEEEKEEIPEEEVPEEIVQPKETPDKVPDVKKSAGGAKSNAVPGG
ncbi:hypothetical protein POL58_44075, partial [Nannocystis sp. ncelm1]